eukprot:TRINITY_DN5238_c0_g1_i1.p1 TRINITY_DN5238_c0_g1~~TRINITY_DN5238_c0_g1_i1.p1  ORF type:complete len:1167 (+),score=310.57 TRINITY_DN5238_c0_g1_i1:174-3503(+)
MSQAQFEELLHQMLSEDNKVRKRAEHQFATSIRTQRPQILQALLSFARQHKDSSLRSACIVIFQNRLREGGKFLFAELPKQVQDSFKAELLNGVEQETNSGIALLFENVICDVAHHFYTENTGTWDEILPFVMKLLASQNSQHRSSGYRLLAELSVHMLKVFTPENFNGVMDLLQRGLQDKSDAKVRVHALLCVVNFTIVFQDQVYRQQLRRLVPLMLETIIAALNSGTDQATSDAVKILKLFIELAETDPGFFKLSINDVANAMLKLATEKTLDNSIRQLSMEFLVSLSLCKASLMRSVPEFSQRYVNACLEMLTDLDTDSLEEWNQKGRVVGDDDTDIEIHNHAIAIEDLDRITQALGGDNIVPHLFNYVPALLENREHWQARYAGVMALQSVMNERSIIFLSPALDKLLGLVLPSLEDSHPRVRFAALVAIQTMSGIFKPRLQRHYHQTIIPALIKNLGDLANQRVVAECCIAVIDYCEEVEQVTLEFYLQPLVEALLKLIQTPSRHVQSSAVTALASICGAAGAAFDQFYSSVTPIVMQIIRDATDPSVRMFRCKAIECIAIIFVSVSKQLIGKDVAPLMDIIIPLQGMEMQDDDPTREFVVQALARISHALGKDFTPYLQHVMPNVLKTAHHNPPTERPSTDMDEEDLLEAGYSQVFGEDNLFVNTALLQDKYSACSMLFCYAAELESGFFPYVEQSSKILVPLLEYQHHDGVVLSAYSALPRFLNCVQKYQQETNNNVNVNELFWYMFPAVLKAIDAQKEQHELAASALVCVHESLAVMGPNTLNDSQVKVVLEMLVTLIMEVTKVRKSQVEAVNADGEMEESVYVHDEIAKTLSAVLHEVGEVFGVIVREHPNQFYANFQHIQKLVFDLLHSDHPLDRQVAVCLFDDLVENTKEKTHSFVNDFIPVLLRDCDGDVPTLRQACVYGLGVCAAFGPKDLDEKIPEIVGKLTALIGKQGSRDGLNCYPTENAIAAFGKILKHRYHVIQSSFPQMVEAYVNWLPCEEDKIEARVAHDMLLEFLSNSPGVVFGENLKNVPKLLQVFGRVMDTELINPTAKNQIIQLLVKMQAEMPGNVMQQAFASLPPENQTKLQRGVTTPTASPSK